jgi:hypothetical protein
MPEGDGVGALGNYNVVAVFKYLQYFIPLLGERPVEVCTFFNETDKRISKRDNNEKDQKLCACTGSEKTFVIKLFLSGCKGKYGNDKKNTIAIYTRYLTTLIKYFLKSKPLFIIV